MAHPIQIILTRQFAGYLSVPTFLSIQRGHSCSTTSQLKFYWVGGSTRLAQCLLKNGRRFLFL